MRPDPQGFIASNITVKLLIQTAYNGLQSYQIAGGPTWIESDKFDVLAKAGHSISTSELLPMLQTLLAERFRLVIHREPNKISGYALVVTKSGAKLREASGTKAEVNRKGTQITALNLRFSQFVEMLTGVVGRPVVDKTGIQGLVDFTLEWARDDGPATLSADGANVAPTPPGPSIFTAVQEQLGLKLEPLAGAGDLFVIDHVERPSEN